MYVEFLKYMSAKIKGWMNKDERSKNLAKKSY